MKKILLFLCAFLAAAASQAQYYYLPFTGSNPGNLNTDAEYPVGGGLPAGWNTLFTGSAATFGTPVWSSNATLPFAFNFNGSPVSSFKVSTSGVLTFSTSAVAVPSETNVALPSTDIPDNSVVVWGLSANANDFIITKTFGVAPNRQHWVQFNSFSHPGSTSIYTYWSIVFEETTNKIYIVDQRTANGALSLTAGIQVNATTAYQVAGSPNLTSPSIGDPSAADNKYYMFTPGVQPSYDLSVTSVTNADYLVLANAPFSITGIIQNLGSVPVTSFTLNYTINGGSPVTAPITGSIAPMGTFQFTHPTTWTPATAGNYTITAWATNINGNPDQQTSNDNGSKQVSVLANVAQRTVLHEVFTSSTCPPCKPGNANLSAITQANPGKAIDIKYQQDFPSPGNDPYQSTESVGRRGYYNVNSIPRMEVDGGWDGNAGSYTVGLLNNAKSKPALVSISGTHTIVGHTVSAQATIDPIGNNIASNNLVAHMIITESRTVKNVRTNGETEFHDVMKKMMTGLNGTPVAPLMAGAPITLNQTYTFPSPVQLIAPKNIFPDSVENFNNLNVVIFLQDKVTKEVFQTATSVRTSSPTGIDENILASSLSVYPNPTNGKVNITFTPEKAENAVLEIYNAVGARVWNTSISANQINGKMIDADLSGQPNGFYFLNLQYGDQVLTKKIVLIK